MVDRGPLDLFTVERSPGVTDRLILDFRLQSQSHKSSNRTLKKVNSLLIIHITLHRKVIWKQGNLNEQGRQNMEDRHEAKRAML